MTDTKKMRHVITLSDESYRMLLDVADSRETAPEEALDMIVTQWHNAAWDMLLDDYDHVAEVSQIEYKLQEVANTLTSEGEIMQKLARDIATRRLLLEAKHGVGEEE